MSIYTSIFLSFIPLIALIAIFKFAIKGYKLHYGLIAVVIGLFSIIPITCIQYIMLYMPFFSTQTILGLLAKTILINGLIEETIKMLFMLLIPFKKQNKASYFASGLTAGLAVGTFEIVIYMLHGLVQWGPRLFTSVLIHTFCAGLSILFIYSVKRRRFNIFPLLIAILMHGIYNFFAATAFMKNSFAFIAILLTILECRLWFSRVSDKKENTEEASKEKTVEKTVLPAEKQQKSTTDLKTLKEMESIFDKALKKENDKNNKK
ncbi:MAG: PrsW family intramembrane metalloprotease [Treponema sp.]|nr:PrsW family intramembrane metalloprotease [Treponema sp.]